VIPDVLVIGAGPAGCVVAARLAAAGARVALAGAASGAGWEGLSNRSRSLLAEEGIEESCGVIDGPVPRGGVWGSARPVLGTEWLVERRALAAALRMRARAAGVLDRDDTVIRVERRQGLWRVVLRDGGEVAAPLVIEARGRRGPATRGPLLLAVGRQFRARPRAVQGAAAAAGTQLHATDFGWCWWAARADGLWVQVVGRPRGGRGASRRDEGSTVPGHPATWIAAAAAQIPALARVLEGHTPEGALVARPAQARIAAQHGDPTRWRVGDAALALDPLSGQGVYEALRGARLVAMALHGVMRGGNAAAAQRHVALRQQESWLRGVRTAASFYRENAGRGNFWAETATAYERLLPGAAPARSAIQWRQRTGIVARQLGPGVPTGA
jgi:flavin-dependent dehydrogenase